MIQANENNDNFARWDRAKQIAHLYKIGRRPVKTGQAKACQQAVIAEVPDNHNEETELDLPEMGEMSEEEQRAILASLDE